MGDFVYDIAIIGGGASGLMLAANLDLGGRAGVILEGTDRLGSKLLMSGGGRCNITHGGSIKVFLPAYGEAGPALRKCLYKYSNIKLAAWLDSLGVMIANEEGTSLDVRQSGFGLEDAGRIFPASMKARDVLDALVSEAASNLWQIETGAKVSALSRASGDSESDAAQDKSGPWQIELEGRGSIKARSVVIACGGITYPETGSDGSIFPMLSNLGVEIRKPRPALAPVYVKDYPYGELSGISIPDVTVTVFDCDESGAIRGRAARMQGDILFTHDGLSGPAVLNASGYADKGSVMRLGYNKELSELPRRMQHILEDRSRGPSGDIKTGLLASYLDHDDFEVTGVEERGMVTRGGIMLSEIDLSTMELRRFARHDEDDGQESMYAIGEAIDADGITGGYNLQLCYSTACTAADDLRKKWKTISERG